MMWWPLLLYLVMGVLFPCSDAISLNSLRQKSISFGMLPSRSIETETDHSTAPLRFRNLRFWGGVVRIYGSYKFHKTRLLFQRFVAQKILNKEVAIDWEALEWKRVHELNSERLLSLCLHLRGFYLKTGQFLATRHDFMPRAYTNKLAKLHDDVPPMSEAKVRRILEEELQILLDNGELCASDRRYNNSSESASAITRVFAHIDLCRPVGCASIAQVHRGRLHDHVTSTMATIPTRDVAVKIQNYEAFELMVRDLKNLKILAKWLRRSGELNFDVLSAVNELSKQIRAEFDFNQEAAHLQAFGDLLQQHRRKLSAASPLFRLQIDVPRPMASTQRLLLMSFLEGRSLSQLSQVSQNTTNSSKVARLSQKHLTMEILRILGEAWALMFFEPRNRPRVPATAATATNEIGMVSSPDLDTGVFHADPHPGNILLDVSPTGKKLGILDWGQVKRLCSRRVASIAELFLKIDQYHKAINTQTIAQTRNEVVTAFLALGIRVVRPNDIESVSRMALTMFDTAQGDPLLVADPFAPDSAVRQNGLVHLPGDLFFVLRVVQIFRGFAAAIDRSMGSSAFSTDIRRWSLAQQFAPHAHKYLSRCRRYDNDSKVEDSNDEEE